MADLIPPAVIEILGDDKGFLATIAQDKAILADWAKSVTNTNLGADSKPFETDLAAVKAQLLDLAKGVTDARLGADAAQFWTEITALRTALSAMSPFDIDVDANIARALAAISRLKGGLASAQIASLAGSGLGGGGGGGRGGGTGGGLGDFFGQLSGGALVNSLYGNASGSFLSRLLSPLTALTTLFSAGFGSVGSLAGLGPEHLAMTGLGLAGSATGAGLGAGLLGLGSLGVTGVGMATDSAGIGQAGGDVKMVTTDYANLNKAIADYGKGSLQATVAQNQLNYDLASFNPIARQAVIAASDMAQGWTTAFDKVTGQAEKTGAAIISQSIGVAEKFLPILGKYATENTAIIQKSLQPLFTWLTSSSGGLKVFTDLEKKFQKDLPTAMHAFDQGLELLFRTIDLVAPKTGGLITSIDKFVTKFNGPEWGKWSNEVNKLIGLFRTWDAFIKILVIDIADIFSKSAGLAAGAGGIIPTLTKDLNELHKAINSPAGGSALSSLFSAHKGEVMALINAMVQLGSEFTKIYLLAAPTLTTIVTLFLQAITAVATFVSKLPGGADLLGISLLLGKMGVLKPLLMGAGKDATLLQKAFAGVGAGIGSLLGKLGGLAAGIFGVEVESVGLRVALGALTTVGVIALAVGIYELISHFGVLRGLMIAGAAGVIVLTGAFIALDAVPIVALIAAVGLALVGLVAGIVWVATHWSETWSAIKHVFGDAVDFLRSGFGTLAVLILGPIAPLVLLALHWSQAWDAIKNVAKDVVDIGKNIIDGLINGVKAGVGKVVSVVKSIGSHIVNGFKDVLGIFSPSTVTMAMGSQLNQGMAIGITTTSGQAINAAKTVANQIVAAFGSINAAGRLAKAVSTIHRVFQGLEAMFADLATLSRMSSKVTAASIGQIVSALDTITANAPLIVTSINNLVTALKALDKTKTVGKDLSNLTAVLGDLVKVFSDLASASTASSAVTITSVANIVTALQNINVMAPVLVAAIMAIRGEFSKLGNMQALNTELSQLNTLFVNLGNVFTSLSKAASDAASVTPASLGQITTAIDNLSKSLGNLPTAVNTVSTQTVTALTTLVTNATNYLNTTGVTLFTQSGANMMEGLKAGIASVAGQVAAAAQASATNAIAAVHSVTKPGSPSRLYTEEGMNWMLGLVNGINAGASHVQGALTSAIPHVGTGSGLAGSATAPATYSPTYHVTITAPGGNPKSITGEFQKMLDAHDKQVFARMKAGSVSGG